MYFQQLFTVFTNFSCGKIMLNISHSRVFFMYFKACLIEWGFCCTCVKCTQPLSRFWRHKLILRCVMTKKMLYSTFVCSDVSNQIVRVEHCDTEGDRDDLRSSSSPILLQAESLRKVRWPADTADNSLWVHHYMLHIMEVKNVDCNFFNSITFMQNVLNVLNGISNLFYFHFFLFFSFPMIWYLSLFWIVWQNRSKPN